MPLPFGVPYSFAYWSRDLVSTSLRLDYPIRLPTEAEIYLYASCVWSTLFDYLLK